FTGVTLADLAATQAAHDTEPRSMAIDEGSRQPAPAAGYYRFGRVELLDEVDLSRHALAEQIGRTLWRALDGPGVGVPSDFVQRHLVVDRDSVGVWSRRGVVLACK